MSTILPNTTLTGEYTERSNDWSASMNRNLRLLDTLTNLRVVDKDLATPPVSADYLSAYIVATGATGAWVDHVGNIAINVSGSGISWEFLTPKLGWKAWVIDEDIFYYFQYPNVWAASFNAVSINTVNLGATTVTATTLNATTINAANLINANGVVTVQSKATTTANIAQRLQAGADASQMTVFSTSKAEATLPRVSCYGTVELNYSNVGTTTATTVGLYTGTGSPEGALTARQGSLYLERGGTKPYYKNTGTGNTGWLQL